MPKLTDLRPCNREVYHGEAYEPCALAWGHRGQCRTREYVDTYNASRRAQYRESAGHEVKPWARYASEPSLIPCPELDTSLATRAFTTTVEHVLVCGPHMHKKFISATRLVRIPRREL
jgi:hypothetical protein